MCVPVAQQADNPASSPDEGDRSAQHERKHSSSAVSSDEVKQPLESDSEYVHVDKVRMSNLSISIRGQTGIHRCWSPQLLHRLASDIASR